MANIAKCPPPSDPYGEKRFRLKDRLCITFTSWYLENCIYLKMK
jgi:hypothetical protein